MFKKVKKEKVEPEIEGLETPEAPVEEATKETAPAEAKPKAIWQIGEVATQTDQVLVNTKTNVRMAGIEALAEILNKLENLEATIKAIEAA